MLHGDLYVFVHVLGERRTEVMCECLLNCVHDRDDVCVMERKTGRRMFCVFLCHSERLCVCTLMRF